MAGWLLSFLSAGALTARQLAAVNRWVVATAALSPYLMPAAPVAALVFALSRHWVPAAAAVALTVTAVAAHLPWYIGGRQAEPGATVRFVTANLYLGRAQPAAVATMALESADIVAVQELTDELSAALSPLLAEDFPFSLLRPRDNAAGVGLWSRFPIIDSGSDESFSRGFIHARVRTPEAEVTVVSTHMPPPRSAFTSWREDIRRLGRALRTVAATGPVIVGSDLNATPDVREFRQLLHDGYRDGAAQANAGLTMTYPCHTPLPPFLAVDHILTRDATATSVRTVSVAGSDHLALAATVVLH
ncbi:endonuclease/exonuclease/phosphatase family protein [Mycobacterium sp. AMU20-3851]|uniref:endonuclease/exonuclease/phosphatase family protein n=1 Tax=Mycobacterium sp. AMU20-3851 TaxID=3122055 RepID=UPI0037553DB9